MKYYIAVLFLILAMSFSYSLDINCDVTNNITDANITSSQLDLNLGRDETSVPGSCLNIDITGNLDANRIVFDCSGHQIDLSSSSHFFDINLATSGDLDQFVVRNCDINWYLGGSYSFLNLTSSFTTLRGMDIIIEDSNVSFSSNHPFINYSNNTSYNSLRVIDSNFHDLNYSSTSLFNLSATDFFTSGSIFSTGSGSSTGRLIGNTGGVDINFSNSTVNMDFAAYDDEVFEISTGDVNISGGHFNIQNVSDKGVNDYRTPFLRAGGDNLRLDSNITLIDSILFASTTNSEINVSNIVNLDANARLVSSYYNLDLNLDAATVNFSPSADLGEFSHDSNIRSLSYTCSDCNRDAFVLVGNFNSLNFYDSDIDINLGNGYSVFSLEGDSKLKLSDVNYAEFQNRSDFNNMLSFLGYDLDANLYTALDFSNGGELLSDVILNDSNFVIRGGVLVSGAKSLYIDFENTDLNIISYDGFVVGSTIDNEYEESNVIYAIRNASKSGLFGCAFPGFCQGEPYFRIDNAINNNVALLLLDSNLDLIGSNVGYFMGIADTNSNVTLYSSNPIDILDPLYFMRFEEFDSNLKINNINFSAQSPGMVTESMMYHDVSGSSSKNVSILDSSISSSYGNVFSIGSNADMNLSGTDINLSGTAKLFGIGLLNYPPFASGDFNIDIRDANIVSSSSEGLVDYMSLVVGPVTLAAHAQRDLDYFRIHDSQITLLAGYLYDNNSYDVNTTHGTTLTSDPDFIAFEFDNTPISLTDSARLFNFAVQDHRDMAPLGFSATGLDVNAYSLTGSNPIIDVLDTNIGDFYIIDSNISIDTNGIYLLNLDGSRIPYFWIYGNQITTPRILNIDSSSNFGVSGTGLIYGNYFIDLDSNKLNNFDGNLNDSVFNADFNTAYATTYNLADGSRVFNIAHSGYASGGNFWGQADVNGFSNLTDTNLSSNTYCTLESANDMNGICLDTDNYIVFSSGEDGADWNATDYLPLGPQRRPDLNAAISLSASSVTVNSAVNITFTYGNDGNFPADLNYTITIYAAGSPISGCSTTLSTNLNVGSTSTYPCSYTPSTTGSRTIRGSIVYSGLEWDVSDNNADASLNVTSVSTGGGGSNDDDDDDSSSSSGGSSSSTLDLSVKSVTSSKNVVELDSNLTANVSMTGPTYPPFEYTLNWYLKDNQNYVLLKSEKVKSDKLPSQYLFNINNLVDKYGYDIISALGKVSMKAEVSYSKETGSKSNNSSFLDVSVDKYNLEVVGLRIYEQDGNYKDLDNNSRLELYGSEYTASAIVKVNGYSAVKRDTRYSVKVNGSEYLSVDGVVNGSEYTSSPFSLDSSITSQNVELNVNDSLFAGSLILLSAEDLYTSKSDDNGVSILGLIGRISLAIIAILVVLLAISYLIRSTRKPKKGSLDFWKHNPDHPHPKTTFPKAAENLEDVKDRL